MAILLPLYNLYKYLINNGMLIATLLILFLLFTIQYSLLVFNILFVNERIQKKIFS